MLFKALLAFLVLGIVASSGLCIAQEAHYAVFDLPSLNTQRQLDAAGGINEAGDTVGGGYNGQLFWRGLLWPHTGGVMDLGTLGGNSGGAGDINDIREVTGSASIEPSGDSHAFLWRNNNMIGLGTLGGRNSVGRAINNRSQIVGQSEYDMGSFAMRAYLWENGQMIELPAAIPNRVSIGAWGINNLGEIVGVAESITVRTGHLWRNGQAMDLGSLAAGKDSQAYAINDIGHIAGGSATARGQRHAVVWMDLQIINIHTLGDQWFSTARDINNHGHVVGFAQGQSGFLAFIKSPGEPMCFLKELAPPRLRLPWRLSDARGINDAGQITAQGEIDGQPFHFWAILLSPVHPSLELFPPSPGRAGVVNTLTVTDARPGATVHFLYSRHGGGTRIPNCDLQTNALQLDSPTVIGSTRADANGVAQISAMVPPIAQNQTILIQAVVVGDCAISQLVVHRFE